MAHPNLLVILKKRIIETQIYTVYSKLVAKKFSTDILGFSFLQDIQQAYLHMHSNAPE